MNLETSRRIPTRCGVRHSTNRARSGRLHALQNGLWRAVHMGAGVAGIGKRVGRHSGTRHYPCTSCPRRRVSTSTRPIPLPEETAWRVAVTGTAMTWVGSGFAEMACVECAGLVEGGSGFAFMECVASGDLRIRKPEVPSRNEPRNRKTVLLRQNTGSGHVTVPSPHRRSGC